MPRLDPSQPAPPVDEGTRINQPPDLPDEEVSIPSAELSLRDRETFFNAVLNPPEPSARLVELAKRFLESTR